MKGTMWHPSGALLDTKQVLGEHLFSKVCEVHAGKADRITGMLLEAENEDVMSMLEDNSLLRRRIEGALRVIEEGESSSSEKEKFGEELYLQVSKIEPIQCAKITGMLLELDAGVIRSLIHSPADLERAVDKSLMSLRADGSQREEYGEELYGILAQRFDPESAAKITGMLLEMDDDQLQCMMQDKALLEDKIRLAMDVLSHQNKS